MNKLISFILPFIFIYSFSQEGKKIDGIAVIIGDQAITESDLIQMEELIKSENQTVTDPCIILKNLAYEKLLLYKAKQDTTVVVSQEDVNREIEGRMDQYRQYFKSDQEIADYFKMGTIGQMKAELEKSIKDREYTTQQRNKIVSHIDVSPEYLKNFYEKYKNEFPTTNEEIEYSQIILFPKLSQIHKEQIIDSLKQIRKEILEGASFSAMAKDYSQDPGSAPVGGLIENVKRGMMVKEFEAVAFSLEEGQISEPFETEYGFHIVLLEKRKGNILTIRHILIANKPNQQEIQGAIDELEDIKNKIKTDKLTFKEAANKYSDDKYTRLNGGEVSDPQTGESKFDKLNLPGKILYHVSGLKEGDLSEVFRDDENGKTIIKLLKISKLISPHKINLETDYNRIKEFAKKEKENEAITKWVKEQIPRTYIKMFNEYKKCSILD